MRYAIAPSVLPQVSTISRRASLDRTEIAEAATRLRSWALITGEVRGIPLSWRLIDCAFGVAGFIPCWLCRRWTRELERSVSVRMDG